MIKINLLAGERKVVKKKLPFQAGQKLTVVCSLILVAAAVGVGWRYWTISRESAQLDADITNSQQETARLHSVIQQVQQFEQRRAQLQQRVALIEDLRKNQTGPVHMLDQVSRALPEMVWLNALRQSAIDPNEVQIEGRATTQTGVSDFVANLEASGYFRRSVEIVTTQVENITGPPGELIRFQLKGMFQQPGTQAASGTPASTAVGVAATKSN